MKPKYQLAFLDMAERFGQTSEATRLKVGAMIVKDGSFPIACGVNGTPSGWPTNVCEDDDGKTLPVVRHAEKAALDKLRNSNETAKGTTMFVSHEPCLKCAIEMVDAGIKEVVFRYKYESSSSGSGVSYLLDHGVVVRYCPPQW